MRPGQLRRGNRFGNRFANRGQALLVAVLLMSVILLVGILFAAIVSYNQEQSARHVDQVAAELQAEAGVQYANSMLQNSPQGADWRPRFVSYDPATYDADDPATWPSPPAMYADGSADPNFFGADGLPDTEDDYYNDFEIIHGWFALRAGTAAAPGDFLRMGFHRFPDPNQLSPDGSARDHATMSRGYFLLQVTYDPDPPYEPGDATSPDRMGGYIRIVSIGRAVEESNAFRRVVAYKPLGLPDHAFWVTDASGSGEQAVLGTRATVDFNASGTVEAGEELPTDIYGPVRSASRTVWVGQDLDPGGTSVPSLRFHLETAPVSDEGYLRDDAVVAGKGLYGLDGATAADGAAVVVDGGPDNVLPVSLDPDDRTQEAHRVYVGNRASSLAAPRLDTVDPNSGVGRYYALTRDSGESRAADVADAEHGIAVGDAANVGLWGHGAGVYVDNTADVQFRAANGDSNLRSLMDDWTRRLDSRRVGKDSGWNATYTTYSPPGVEIEFFPTEAAVLAMCPSRSYSTTPPTSPGVLWWPDHGASGTEPGIIITRHDHRWRRGDATHVGEDSGRNVMVVSYPRFPNQVIFAEGNVRVKGVLPPAERDAGNSLVRDYNLTVVSNGTIYVDGQILSPQDVAGRNADGLSSGIRDEDNTGVALLARDCVCLNPTQLVPQLTLGLVTAAADDEANPSLMDQHWELYPDSGGQAYTQWRMGWPDMGNRTTAPTGAPGTPVGPGVTVSLVAIQAGADPGPSGMGMNTYNSVAGTEAPYVFAGTGSVVDPYTFLFVPPGARIPSSSGLIPTPTRFASNAIAPNWQVPGPSPYYDFRDGASPAISYPQVPFDITGYVTKTIGASNVVSLFHRDPQVGSGATPYLVKRWKVEESEWDAADGYALPRGAVHARINAVMFAQRGCWFVIPGEYFDPTAATRDYDGNGTVDALDSLYAARFRRYNYEITVRGSITQDHTAPLDMVQDWTRKWAYPIYSGSGGSLTLTWGGIRYEFDERVRVSRDQSLTDLVGTVRRASVLTVSPESSLPKLPCLPSSPTLIYSGGTH
jgi:hypothetical protein